jgi:heme exporter protein D
MSEWLAMGGYAFFVWSSYGLSAAVIVWNLLALRNLRRRVRGLIEEEYEDA